ncbi:phage baseplate assembly protein V [Brevibacillus sp. MER 51]|uniref:phage baseplate assembly protein V n=1 Tax=Brevibacillus sp. MER 51 TaxID=2939560 RepID=UPI0020417EF5|nr:phage baseplate assembly protein V [Brevibacillus sp. MER 51]MCM3141297.1 phage baseplate assembly protein V [Brevibacillus sp. MER 51]
MSVLKNLIRIGLVSSVNEQKGTVRVVFEDKDDMVSGDLPVLFRHSMKIKEYSLPAIREQVACMFLGNGIQEGLCLGSFYSLVDMPPVQDKNKHGVWFEDGSYVYYDTESGRLHVKAVSDVYIEGNLHVKGKIFTGDSS